MILRELATEMTSALDEGPENLRRKRFLEDLNRQYTALSANADAWGEEVRERRLWEQTAADGSQWSPNRVDGMVRTASNDRIVRRSGTADPKYLLQAMMSVRYFPTL
jgi:hypothetical protein